MRSASAPIALMTDGPPIILASSSPYRRSILERIGLEFQSCSPEIDESPMPGESPDDMVLRLSEAKAAKVARQFPEGLIIGSDQLAVLNGQILCKPTDHEDAVAQLLAASGSSTRLHCGMTLLNAATGRRQSVVEHVEVECRSLTVDEIERYLLTARPYDCCGSLKVEGPGIALLSRIRSDDPNSIIGLPVIRLLSMLRNEGVELI